MGDAMERTAGPVHRRRWLALLAAVVLGAGALVLALPEDLGRTMTETAGDTTTTTSTTTTPTTTTTTSTTTTAAPTTTTTTRPPAVDGLRLGASGDEVVALQQRLTALGYWLGATDGRFGDATHHAVVALQKVAGLARDGVVGPATRDALERGAVPVPRSTSGLVVEIDLARQVLLVADAGRLVQVFDTSTGSVPGTTPAGDWVVERQIDGLRRSPLGLLYRPKYFHEGVAVHGYTSVPPYPASHGCVRVTYPAMDAIWAGGLMPIGTPVWVR